MNKLVAAAVASVAMSVFADDVMDSIVSGSGPSFYIASTNVTCVHAVFSGNSGITEIIAEGATSVKPGAFRACPKLRVVSLPNIVSTDTFGGMFSGCPSLVEITLTSIDFPETGTPAGFPWNASNQSVVFHFRNGDFDRNGNRIE